MEGQKTEVGGQKSEIRGQKTEDSEETLEVGGALRLRLEAGDRGRKTEVGGQKSEIRRQRAGERPFAYYRTWYGKLGWITGHLSATTY